MFLANIGDTDQRCSKKWPPGRDIPKDHGESYLNECNDAVDDVQRNPKYLAPLRTLPIAKLSDSAKGSIHLTDKVAASKVRIFFKEGDDWTYVSANYTFTAEDLKGGLELGIDARDVRRPRGWDGRVKVHFTVTDGDQEATDCVALRVAPVLTHHHLQPAERVFTGTPNGNVTETMERFIGELKDNVAAAGISEPVYEFDTLDIWAQDFFEAGYTSIPGPDGPIVLRVMIRSAQTFRRSGREIFHELRNDEVGAVQHSGNGDTIDAMGNVETIPPYKHKGKIYPAGRIVQGQREERKPIIFEFLKAQEVQDPITLDTDWLAVGHVDEFLQFLPYDNERGWILMVDDPMAGVELLKKASKEGHGSAKAISRPKIPGDDPVNDCTPKQTIDEVLDLINFEPINEIAATRIGKNIAILKRETGLTDAEILYLPSLYYYAWQPGWSCDDPTNSTTTPQTSGTSSSAVPTSTSDASPDQDPAPGAAVKLSKKNVHSGPVKSIIEASQPDGATHLDRRDVAWENQLTAMFTGSINSLVLSGSSVIAPTTWGPVVGGEDIFAKAVQEAYAKAGVNVTFQDAWFPYHVNLGEIHCATNTWRTTDTKWW